MTAVTAPAVAGLYRYPVKGLSPQPLAEVALRPGETFPLDRAYAIENGGGRFDPAAPRHLPKIHFLMLMRDEALAALHATFEDAGHTLTLRRDGHEVLRAALATAEGRTALERFMADHAGANARGAPKVVHADGHSFSDKAAKVVHIVNLATVRALEKKLGRPLDPLRFRANIHLDGAEPWSEFDWIDTEIAIGGSARLAVIARTGRCAATEVEPGTGRRDIPLPGRLAGLYGHKDFGVYAQVLTGGHVAPGDPVSFAVR